MAGRQIVNIFFIFFERPPKPLFSEVNRSFYVDGREGRRRSIQYFLNARTIPVSTFL